MLSRIVKTTLMSLIPRMIIDGYNYINLPGPIRDAPTRKAPDTTKINQVIFDIVNNEHKYWLENGNYASNGVYCANQEELTKVLNAALGLNKSRASYARIFNGHITRSELPVGEPINGNK